MTFYRPLKYIDFFIDTKYSLSTIAYIQIKSKITSSLKYYKRYESDLLPQGSGPTFFIFKGLHHLERKPFLNLTLRRNL